MRRIPLRDRYGKVRRYAVVDDADYELVSAYRWHLLNKGEAVAATAYENGVKTGVLMHRLIMGLGSGDPREVDHRNRKPCDNRRKNLRVVLHKHNGQNCGPSRGSASRYRGVSYDRRRKKWIAQCKVGGKNHWLGYYSSERAAARAARAWRREHLPFSEV